MRCPCGDSIILADTDEWVEPRCFDCWHAMGEPKEEPKTDDDGHRIVEPPRKRDQREDAPLKRTGKAVVECEVLPGYNENLVITRIRLPIDVEAHERPPSKELRALARRAVATRHAPDVGSGVDFILNGPGGT